MHISLISLRVPRPEEVSTWYRTHLGLTIMATHPQTGRIVLATDEPGTSLIFLPGDLPDHPERIQLHFHYLTSPIPLNAILLLFALY